MVPEDKRWTPLVVLVLLLVVLVGTYFLFWQCPFRVGRLRALLLDSIEAEEYFRRDLPGLIPPEKSDFEVYAGERDPLGLELPLFCVVGFRVRDLERLRAGGWPEKLLGEPEWELELLGPGIAMARRTNKKLGYLTELGIFWDSETSLVSMYLVHEAGGAVLEEVLPLARALAAYHHTRKVLWATRSRHKTEAANPKRTRAP